MFAAWNGGAGLDWSQQTKASSKSPILRPGFLGIVPNVDNPSGVKAGCGTRRLAGVIGEDNAGKE